MVAIEGWCSNAPELVALTVPDRHSPTQLMTREDLFHCFHDRNVWLCSGRKQNQMQATLRNPLVPAGVAVLSGVAEKADRGKLKTWVHNSVAAISICFSARAPVWYMPRAHTRPTPKTIYHTVLGRVGAGGGGGGRGRHSPPQVEFQTPTTKILNEKTGAALVAADAPARRRAPPQPSRPSHSSLLDPLDARRAQI